MLSMDLALLLSGNRKGKINLAANENEHTDVFANTKFFKNWLNTVEKCKMVK